MHVDEREGDPRLAKPADAGERAYRPVPIQDALATFISKRGLGRTPLSGRVFSAWREAAGEALARRAKPARFRGGELLVEVNSPTHYQELVQFTGEELRLRANKILGAESIRRLVFKRRT